MAPPRGRGRGGRSRGAPGRGSRGGRGSQRFGRIEARGRNNAFESARIVEDEELQESPDVSESEKEFNSAEESSSEDEEIASKPRAYNLLLQSFGHIIDEEDRSRKRRKVELNRNEVQKAGENRGSSESSLEEDDASQEAEELEDEINGAEEALDPFEGDEDSSDPYEIHFANPDENELAQKLKAVAENRWHTARQPFGSNEKCTVCTPSFGVEKDKLDRPVPTAETLKLKKKLVSAADTIFPNLDGILKPLASDLFEYRDILFGARTVRNAETLRRLTCLHALNLVFKTRDRVLKNNDRLAKEDADTDLEYRDQGFTRPKVLVLLPTRQSCVRLVDTLSDLCQAEQQENKKRFEDQFGQPEESPNDDQPEDYRELMEGNTDDMFRLGMKFTRKTSKYFSQFYNSDIIIASPLGLRRALDSNTSKKIDYDFLSSIELLILDQTDALLQQNWQHIEYIFQHLNLQPQEAHGCDFSRVRPYYLDSNAKYLRQTVILSAFITPELNTLFNNHMKNIAGKIKFQIEYKGAMLDIGLRIKQTFSRVDSPSIIADPESRFKYFTTAILPSMTRYPKPPDGALGVLVFIPNYFDFVRVRNYFANSTATQNISFGSISENSSPADREIRRARSHFQTGKHSVLLYTGRAHHFFRYKIRGVKKIVLYGLPDNPIFYQELTRGFLGKSLNEGKIEPSEASVRVMFSRYDALKVERVVGSTRAGRLLKDGSGDTFDFI